MRHVCVKYFWWRWLWLISLACHMPLLFRWDGVGPVAHYDLGYGIGIGEGILVVVKVKEALTVNGATPSDGSRDWCLEICVCGSMPWLLSSVRCTWNLIWQHGHSKCSKDIGPTYFKQMEIWCLEYLGLLCPTRALWTTHSTSCPVPAPSIYILRDPTICILTYFLKIHFSLKIKLWNYNTQKCQIELMLYIAVVPEKGTFTSSFCNLLDNTLVW